METVSEGMLLEDFVKVEAEDNRESTENNLIIDDSKHAEKICLYSDIQIKQEPLDWETYGEQSKLTVKLETEDNNIESTENNLTVDRSSTNYTEKNCSDSDIQIKQEPLDCETCSERFDEQSKPTEHIKCHAVKKSFVCEVCGERCTTIGNLRKHALVHSDKQAFPCDFCKQKFATKFSLLMHVRIHTGMKRFSCKFCGKKFAGKYYLRTHTLTHTVERPFACFVCFKTFPLQSGLNKHIQIHRNKKPFACYACKKTFSRYNALAKHMQESMLHLGKHGI